MVFFFFNGPGPPRIYTLPPPDALPFAKGGGEGEISPPPASGPQGRFPPATGKISWWGLEAGEEE